MEAKHWFTGLALLFCCVEAASMISLSLGLSFAGVIGTIAKRSGKKAAAINQEEEEEAATAPAPAAESSEAPPLDAEPSVSPPATEPSRPAAEASTPSHELSGPTGETSAPAPASETSAPTAAPEHSALLPTDISFTFSNALVYSTEGEGGEDGLGAVAEEEEEEGSEEGLAASDSFLPPCGDEQEQAAAAGEEGDQFFECAELVFEPSNRGVPGMRMAQRNISGLGEWTVG